MRDYSTSLAKVKGLGSAKEGVNHWWRQRISALALIPLVLWCLYSLVTGSFSGYENVIAWIKKPVTAPLLIIFLATVYYHGLLGIQVVIEDYVHNAWAKNILLIGFKFVCIFAAVVGIFAVLSIYFKG